MSLENEEKTLSSSPCFLGSSAKVTMGREDGMAGSRRGLPSVVRVSPVTVSLSLATAPKAPGPRLGTAFWPLPSSIKSWPNRSGTARVALRTVESAAMAPE